MRKRIDSFTDERNIFARRLEFALKADKIDQREFSEKIGVTPTIVSRYISGMCTPSYANLMKIQKALDVSLDWLCGLVD